MPLWAAATSCTDCVMASVYLHTFPHTFYHFPLFTVSTASTFIFRTGGHFPAVGDRLRQVPLAKNGPGGPFLAGDTYLRDRPLPTLASSHPRNVVDSTYLSRFLCVARSALVLLGEVRDITKEPR